MRTHHFVNLFGQTPPMVIPVVVAARAGGAAAAAFGAAWQIAGTVGLLSPAVATGLFAAAGSDGRALPDRARATARQVALVIGAAGLVLVVAGPRLLAVVGPGYVDRGLPALRLLAVALVADAVTNVEIARLRVLGDFRSAISLNGLMAAVAVGGAFVLVGEHGATGAAAAWLAAQAVGAGSAWQRARWRDGRRYPARQEAAA
jgi:O-antigen/teichoic acid export membrane protein